MYNSTMDIEFDPEKNAANIRKHGISLTDVDGVLHDPQLSPWRTKTTTSSASSR